MFSGSIPRSKSRISFLRKGLSPKCREFSERYKSLNFKLEDPRLTDESAEGSRSNDCFLRSDKLTIIVPLIYIYLYVCDLE